MSNRTWLSKVPWPVRLVLISPVRLYVFVLEYLIAWKVEHETEFFLVQGLKLFAPPGPNQSLYIDRLRSSLALLAERSPRMLREVQREIAAVVVLPRRLWRGGAYAGRARVVMLDQVAVWRWNLESLAVEIAGWATDARLRRAGFGGERYRDRREHRVLLTRIRLGGVLLGMEDSAAELLAQARRERKDAVSSRKVG